MKKLFFLDYKTIDDSNLLDTENSILQILKRYSLKIGDYEQNELTEAIFNRLGWSNKYKDSIFSFRTIVCKIFEVYSINHEIKLDSGARIIFYFRNNTLEYEINGQKKKEYRYNKETLFIKATDKNSALQKVVNIIFTDKEIFDKLEIVAKLVDSLSNFTTHPSYPFNQAKGNSKDVADSLNLMIDKVQNCINNNENLKYGDEPYKIIEVEKLLEWKEWFVSNQISYCLNDIYIITKDEEIIGIKLFAEQSLEKPLPTNREEIKEYLKNIIKILRKRGKTMNESIR